MTYEELRKVPFRWRSHLSMEDEHVTTYSTEDNRIGFSDHVPYKDGEPCGRVSRVWQLDGKIYVSKKKFLEALSEFSFNVVPMYRKR